MEPQKLRCEAKDLHGIKGCSNESLFTEESSLQEQSSKMSRPEEDNANVSRFLVPPVRRLDSSSRQSGCILTF